MKTEDIKGACKFLKKFAVSNSGKLELKPECNLFKETNFSKNQEREIDLLIEKEDWLNLFENLDWLLLLDAIQNQGLLILDVHSKLKTVSDAFPRQTDRYICRVML
ncbi:MAG: hypothetical protein WCX46_03535 [Candidatus Paceibacterota bacterium]